MLSAEREQMILEILRERGFIGFQELERRIEGSPATLRRDLSRLDRDGKIIRVRGGARLAEGREAAMPRLSGVPFHENVNRHRKLKQAIGRAAADLCNPGETVIIDGGSTTLQMCPHLERLGLHVLTNSLHIVSALLPQEETRVSVPAGTIFREQNIILPPFEDDGMNRFRAAKLFVGAAAIGRHGLMQTDVLLVQAEHRMLRRADITVALVDSSKFSAPAGHIVCGLEDIDILITDDRLTDDHAKMLESAGIKLIVVA